MKLTLSREYMSESYDQARRHGSIWRFVEWAIGLTFISLGIGLYIYAHGKTVMPIALLVIGFFELFSHHLKKYFWLRRHTKSKLMNAEIELKVTEAGIDSTGPFSNGCVEWGGIEKAVRTPKGILIWPQKGMYWYLPESIAGSQTIDFIRSKIA
ncbi:MAG: hypothetical protein V4812_10555 [Pseudomonadota bacterium]